jgi:glycosyltransferase involved in cell wall biosynthesis
MKLEDISIASPLNNLSYGLASLNLIKRLHNHRKIVLFPIGSIQLEDKDDTKLIQELVNNQNTINIGATSLRIYHQFDLVQRIGKGPHIGWPIFELDTFTKREDANISSCDKLIVCSKWAAKVVYDNFGIDASVVPLGVDRSIFYESTSDKWYEPFTFLCVGKIEVRKGHDLLPHLFAKALPKDENWQLRMLWGNPFLPKDEKQHWVSYYKSILGDRVTFSDRVATQKDVANEMREADCGISISRAEGWNLPLLELMSCGKPVIATNYSGHTEFCDNDNSFLINMESGLETANDGRWFHGHGRWAKLGELEQEQIINSIRKVYSLGRGNVNNSGIETAKRFSWENAVKKLMEIV